MSTPLTKVTDFLGFTNTKRAEPVRPSGGAYNPDQEPRRTLHTWEADSRTNFSPTGKVQINRTFLIIGVVVAIFLAAMGEVLLIAVVASIIFLQHILAATPAEKVRHTISNYGIDYAGEFYGWEELRSFFISSKEGVDTLCVDTIERLPGRLYLLLNQGDTEKIRETVGTYITYLQQEPKNLADRVYEAATDKINVK